MRVLHVISSLDPKHGGPVTALKGLAAAQTGAGLDVRVFSAFAAGTNPESSIRELRDHGAIVTAVGPLAHRLDRRAQVRASLAQQITDAQVVHIHGLWEEVLHQAAVLARAIGRPYLVCPHGMLDRWSLRQRWLKKRLYLMLRTSGDLRAAAAIHCITAWEADQVRQRLPHARIIVEPIGIDLSDVPPVVTPEARSRARAELGLPTDRPIIVFLGRVHPGKGVEYLLPALARMKLQDAFLAVIGPDSGDFGDRMRSLSARLGLSDRVQFLGAMMGPDKWKGLSTGDLLCLPSEHENFGVVVIEALALGIPVVLSDQVAIWKEVVDAGVGGAVPLDPAKLADELDRWLSAPPLHLKATEGARPFATERFDWRSIGRGWVGDYHSLPTAPR